jgi:hypothetical protein
MLMGDFYKELLSAGISLSYSVTQAGTITFPGIDGEYEIRNSGNTIVRVK